MRQRLPSFLFVFGLLLQACSPTFNWRDVRLTNSPMQALFPCKPDETVRSTRLNDLALNMTMLSCDAGDVTFNLAYAQLSDRSSVGATLGAWKASTLQNLKPGVVKELAFVPKGASDLPQSVKLALSATRPDGRPLALHAVWFASGSTVYQAAVMSERNNPAVAETFLSGLQRQ